MQLCYLWTTKELDWLLPACFDWSYQIENLCCAIYCFPRKIDMVLLVKVLMEKDGTDDADDIETCSPVRIMIMIFRNLTIPNKGRGSGWLLVCTCQHGRNWKIDGSCQLCSDCFDHVDNSLANSMSLTFSSQCCSLVHQRPRHVLSCLCDNAYKRSLAICSKSRTLCSVSRLLPPLYSLHVLKRDVIIIKQTKEHYTQRIQHEKSRKHNCLNM